MAKQQETRKLLKEDTRKHEEYLSSLKKAFPHIKKLANVFADLSLGQFTQERYLQLLTSVEPIRAEYVAAIKAQLSKAGLAIPGIEEKLLEGTGERIDSLAQAAGKIKEFSRLGISGEVYGLHSVDLTYISIVDGEPCVTEEISGQIMEQFCRTYISTPEELALYGRIEALKEAYNSLTAELKGISFPMYHHGFEGLRNFLQEQEDKTVIINPDAPTWAANLQRRLSAFNAR